MTSGTKNSIDESKNILEQNAIKSNAQKQHAITQEATDKLMTFKQLVERDFGLQLKLPGSHAQRILGTVKMLAAIKKRQQEVAVLIAQIIHFLKEALRAIRRAESHDNAAEYEHWRKHAGGEGRTEQQLISERRAQAEEHRTREHALQELREQAATLTKARVECEKQLKQMLQEYDAKYQALDESYVQDHDSLAKELTVSKSQLTEAHHAQLIELAQTVTQLHTDAQETQAALQQLDVTRATKLAELELPKTDLTTQYEAKLEVVNQAKIKHVEALTSKISDAAQAENLKANIDTIRDAYSSALDPAQELKALFKFTNNEHSVISPSKLNIARKGLDALVADKAQEEEIKTSYRIKFNQLEIERERAEQQLSELHLFQKQKLKDQYKATLQSIGKCDEQCVAITQKYEDNLQLLDQNHVHALTSLETKYSAEKTKLEAEQATKIKAIDAELSRIDKAQAQLKQEIQALTKPATDKLQVEAEQADEKRNYKTPTMFNTDLSKR